MAHEAAPPEKNFWLWGTWGKRKIPVPFLTQKVPGCIRDVVIGERFIVSLKEDGTLVSWGEDATGALGLGADRTASNEPSKIVFPSDFTGKVVDIQLGKHHVLALTSDGKVYSWGENTGGQLGLSDLQGRYEPAWVEELKHCTMVQIVAVENMSYALSSKGVVYAWGENKDGALGLEHSGAKVTRPEPLLSMSETCVQKLLLKECGATGKGKTVIGIVNMAEPFAPKDLPGGFERPLIEAARDNSGIPEQALLQEQEDDIFEGVDLMRRTVDNALDWWKHVTDIRHGAPYEEDAGSGMQADEEGNALQLDMNVSLEHMERAAAELDKLIVAVKDQFREIKKKKEGAKNVRFVLELFEDNCRLRREKIRNTIASRQLVEHKQLIPETVLIRDLREVAKLNDASKQLTRVLQRLRKHRVSSIFTRALKDSLAEAIEGKLQVHETQIEYLKARGGNASDPPADIIEPALRVIKERWSALKSFSILNLYQEFQKTPGCGNFRSDEELMSHLTQVSDSQIDHIIMMDRDRLISRDLLVPGLCYDLLVENAELRKMSNTYQLNVLLLRSGRNAARIVGGSGRGARVER